MPYKIIQTYADVLGGNDSLVVRGPMSPLLLMVPWHSMDATELATFMINKGRDTLCGVDDERYKAIGRNRLTQYWKDEVSLKYLQDEYTSLAYDVDTLYEQQTEVDFSKASTESLLVVVKEILKVFEDMAQKTVYIETVDRQMVLDVLGEDKKEFLDEIWENATHPTFMSFDGRRLGLLVDMIESGKTSSALIRKSRFIYTDYFWSKKDAEIESALGGICTHLEEKKKEFAELQKSAATQKTKYDAWHKGLSPEAQKITNYIQLVMHFRDVRKDIIAKIQALECEISVELLRRAGIDEKHAPYILLYEFLKGIEHLKSIQDQITQRVNGCLMIVNPDTSYDVELCDFNKAMAEFESKIFVHDTDVTSFKGQVANKGKLTGTVRIVLDPHGYQGFNAGDILVTSMTRPEFVPLMRQAGAVITNEGGITCHAAIVSRELNIPCIIGTKIATRVLKDGDRVEVDAEKGVVTILDK